MMDLQEVDCEDLRWMDLANGIVRSGDWQQEYSVRGSDTTSFIVAVLFVLYGGGGVILTP